MTARKLHLAAFVSAGPVSGSHGGWRHPKADSDLLSAAYYQNIGRLLEEGRFDLLFIADIVAIPDTLGGSLDSQLRYGTLGALRLDPLVVLSLIAGATKHLGLGATISTHTVWRARWRRSTISAAVARHGTSSRRSRKQRHAISG